MKRTIMVNEWKKIEITDEEMVQYFEKNGWSLGGTRFR